MANRKETRSEYPSSTTPSPTHAQNGVVTPVTSSAPASTRTAKDLDLTATSLYINRELSWLEFNRRVLEEAQDATVPLLERLKFLAIFGSNLDEFNMVRVGGLKEKVEHGKMYGSGADRTPVNTQLEKISQVTHELLDHAYHCLHEELLPALIPAGIQIRGLHDLTVDETHHVNKLFREEIYPVLSPIAVDFRHPFPQTANGSLNLAVLLKRPSRDFTPLATEHNGGHRDWALDELLVIVPLPTVFQRFLPLPCPAGDVFIAMETIIALNLPELLPNMEVLHHTVFRVTRNSDFEIGDEEVEDLRIAIQENVRKRRVGSPVALSLQSLGNLENGGHASKLDQLDGSSAKESSGARYNKRIERFLQQALHLQDHDIYRSRGPLGLSGFWELCSLSGYDHLKEAAFEPCRVSEIDEARDIWNAIRTKDYLLHHPYESFNHVVEFLQTAATDDQVLAIKMTLYRTSGDSPIIRALQLAADKGKQVTVVIELHARMDEERNSRWAGELEKHGVHVVFGLVGLKIHCKIALVVRRDEDRIRRYAHLATGNYHPHTARIYTDLGYFTCDPDICADASMLFNQLTSYCAVTNWRKLIVGPRGLQVFLREKIESEIAAAEQGQEARIIAKINGLLDPTIVQMLYRASQAGVQIDLICRGICSLRPQLPGISDNIRVISIVDRFLEHSRIFYFHSRGNPEVFVGSADLMDRNLMRRVEVLFPITPERLRTRVIEEILELSLRDNVKARVADENGQYHRVRRPDGSLAIRSQVEFLRLAEEQTNRFSGETTASRRIPDLKPHEDDHGVSIKTGDGNAEVAEQATRNGGEQISTETEVSQTEPNGDTEPAIPKKARSTRRQTKPTK
ncbi:MAG: polyphosphate kinase 1 [Gemmataceae bacterium]